MRKISIRLITSRLLAGLVSMLVLSAFADERKDRWTQFLKAYYKPLPTPELAENFGPNIGNKVFKPTGEGPFPAVVLVHTAGGLSNDHIKRHAQNLLAKGYVVLVQDSMGPRGVRVINDSTRVAHPIVGVKDAVEAWGFLSQQNYVDKERIYEAGMSYGGFVASLVASKSVAEFTEAKGRFRATVSFYSTCNYGPSKLIIEDTDRPLLMLLAGSDRELKHGSCFKDLEEMKSKGLPIHYHIYEGIGHGWDKQGEVQYGYVYNDEVTKDSFNRMVDFFERHK
jgi:dienelactone hydrolase